MRAYSNEFDNCSSRSVTSSTKETTRKIGRSDFDLTEMETLKGWPDAPSSLVVLGAGALGFFLSNFEVANDFLLDRGRDEPRPPAKLLAPDRAAPLAPPLSAEEGVDRILAASTRSFEDAEALLDRARRTPPASPQRAGARKQSPLLRAQNLVSDAIELPPRLPEIIDL